MADDATRADKAGGQQWEPRTAETLGVISVGQKVGKPIGAARVRRHAHGDQDMGTMEETVLDGWRVKEISPGHWAADTDEGN